MNGLLHDSVVILRLILLLGFCLAGVAKLRNVGQTRQMLIDFGVHGSLVAIGAVTLALLEILTAVALALSGTVGGWLALGLLLTFTAAIQLNLSRGRQPDCHCFGQLKPSPIGTPTLVRNVILALAAGTVIWASANPSASLAASLLEQATIGQRAILVLSGVQMAAIAVLGLIGWQVVKQQGRILVRLDLLESGAAAAPASNLVPTQFRIGLPMGTPAPDFMLANIEGSKVRMTALLQLGSPLLLVFSSPHCSPCRHLLPELGDFVEELRGRLTIVIVSEGSDVDHAGYPTPEHVLLQDGREVAEQYQAWGTPAAVLVRPDGSIGSGVAAGAEQIGALVESIRVSPRPAGTLGRDAAGFEKQPKADASTLELPDLDGVKRPVLHSPQGDTMLLFWNTQCGFCQRMEGRLRHWISNRLDSDPNLILIANGDLAGLRALDLDAPIFVDTAFVAGASFGAGGTPMAVVVNKHGRPASAVVAGEDAIFALLDPATRAEVPS